jgi:beta-glucosidase
MCAMNRINGSWGCENSPLLNGLLKNELAFHGCVTPDTSGQHTALGSANGGLDFGASSFWNNETLLPALANGSPSQARLGDTAARNLMAYFHEKLDQTTWQAVAGFTDLVIGPAITFDDAHNHNTRDGHLILTCDSGMSIPLYMIPPYDAILAKALVDGTQMMWLMNVTVSIDYIAVTGIEGTSAAPTLEGYAAAAET